MGIRHLIHMENINFVAIDIEACNMDVDAPCKIGITEVINGVIINSFYELINPGKVYFEGIISGNSLQDLQTHPELPDVWTKIEPVFRKYEYLVCHGDGYDFRLLANAFTKYHITFPNIKLFSSKNVARKVYNELPSFEYSWLCKMLNIKVDQYEAKRNSEICAEILLKCIEKTQVESIEQLCENIKLVIGSFSSDGSYTKSFPKHVYQYDPNRKKTTVKDIIPNVSKQDETHLLFQQNVVFTGKLSTLIRKNAQQMVADIGGHPQDTVTKDTDFLVVGQQDYRVVGEDGMSSKQEKAIKMKEKGIPIEIISENEFIEMFS